MSSKQEECLIRKDSEAARKSMITVLGESEYPQSVFFMVFGYCFILKHIALMLIHDFILLYGGVELLQGFFNSRSLFWE